MAGPPSILRFRQIFWVIFFCSLKNKPCGQLHSFQPKIILSIPKVPFDKFLRSGWKADHNNGLKFDLIWANQPPLIQWTSIDEEFNLSFHFFGANPKGHCSISRVLSLIHKNERYLVFASRKVFSRCRNEAAYYIWDLSQRKDDDALLKFSFSCLLPRAWRVTVMHREGIGESVAQRKRLC